eukprot:Skav224815  [mRNA]  locus=scaffold21:116613:120850:+ [translate_table: standard]
MVEMERAQREWKKRRRSAPAEEVASKTPRRSGLDSVGSSVASMAPSRGTPSAATKTTPRWHPNGYWVMHPAAASPSGEEQGVQRRLGSPELRALSAAGQAVAALPRSLPEAWRGNVGIVEPPSSYSATDGSTLG